MINKRKWGLCVLMCLGLNYFDPVRINALAATEIPERMQENSVIEYITEDTYVVLQGGEVEEGHYNENHLTYEEQQIVDTRNQMIKTKYSDMNSYTLSNPVSIEGMVVYYDARGCIKEIDNPVALYYNPLPRGTTASNGTYTYGIYGSTIVITDTRVEGYGQITVFSDNIGERDNVLEKGDVATKGEIDNPVHGKILSVSIPLYNTGTQSVKPMYKRDNGLLPNAILDIWKDGVEYWGYTYSSSLSFLDGHYAYYK